VPLDPGHPDERLAFLLADSGASVLVTETGLAGRLGAAATEVPLLVDDADLATEPGEDPPRRASPSNLAYSIYTSGSTGRPKGVLVEHRQLASYVRSVSERLGLDEATSFATVSTFAADLGHTCLFPALGSGACLHLIDEEKATDPEALSDELERHAIDVLKIVPSHLAALLDGSRPASLLPRQRLVLGGEAWGDDLRRRLAELKPRCRVFNHYGPTETTVGVLVEEVALAGAEAAGAPSLGRPLAGRHVVLRGRRDSVVPLGTVGEILIGGAGVARGYAGNPRLTAERFVPDPFAGRPGARLYRTGDRGRRLADGRIVFLGRVDRQIKFHGHRIEPDEIRAALALHPKVRDSVVLLRRDGAGREALVVYYVSRQEIADEELRDTLRQRLIEETIPQLFIHLRRLPLTLNGKLNLDALPDLAELRGRSRSQPVPPRTPAEQTLAEIWTEVLGVAQPSVHDSFFHLGGHSLLATRVISRVRQGFGIDLPLRTLFERPTIAGLAVAVTEAQLAAEDGDEVARLLAELSSLAPDEVQKALDEELGRVAGEGAA
jgi:amino acid adenylation domain-containing protein